MSDESTRQSIIDEEHLKLLSLGYMISAATTAFFSLIGLMYMAMGIFMNVLISHQKEADTSTAQAPPAFVGWLFAAIGLGMFLFLFSVAAVKLRTAICIRRRQSRTFCMVVAGIGCLEIPYGTILGVLSFMVLGRNSVTRLFSPTTPPGSTT